MNGGALELQEVWFAYPDGTEALKGVSFSVEPGSAVALVGANGAGKSTVLLQLVGYHQPTRGEVRIGGVPMTKDNVSALRRSVGMVFQNPDDQLFMPTVFDDVAFGPVHAGLPDGEVRRRVDEALARVGMAHAKDRPAHRLSAGEKRAVAVATVLSMQPDVLVMDEPSSFLDPRARRRLIDQLKAFSHTRLLATHDLEMVVEVCSRVIVMDGGRVVADGETYDVLNDSALMLRHGLERPHILSHHHPH